MLIIGCDLHTRPRPGPVPCDGKRGYRCRHKSNVVVSVSLHDLSCRAARNLVPIPHTPKSLALLRRIDLQRFFRSC